MQLNKSCSWQCKPGLCAGHLLKLLASFYSQLGLACVPEADLDSLPLHGVCVCVQALKVSIEEKKKRTVCIYKCRKL